MKLRSLLQIALLFPLTFVPSYFVEAQECPSLVVNGDFANPAGGGFGFTSHYVWSPNNVTVGSYAITKNAAALNPYFVSLADHSPSGTTYYMVVDADVDNNKAVWKSTVTVKKGVTYEFSFWIANIHMEFQKANPDTQYAIQPAKVQFVMNNQSLIKVNTKPDTQWRQYVQLYTATQDITFDIALRNNANVTPLGGNDFALDDISFKEVCITTGDSHPSTTVEAFSVYPNPNKSGTLHFGKKASSFRLLSIDNTELLQGTESESLSTNGLAKGMYFLRLENKIFKILIE